MKIKIIEYDYESFEATVKIVLSVGDIICYSYLENIEKINEENIKLVSLYPTNIVLSQQNSYEIEKTNKSFYSYKITGRVTKERFVEIEGIFIDVENRIPKDIVENMYVTFETVRLDLSN